MPLPASGNHCQSASCCGPYLRMEKLQVLARFAPRRATQSSIGRVSIAWDPACRHAAMKLSPISPGTADASPMLWKYQSAARLVAFCCQL